MAEYKPAGAQWVAGSTSWPSEWPWATLNSKLLLLRIQAALYRNEPPNVMQTDTLRETSRRHSPPAVTAVCPSQMLQKNQGDESSQVEMLCRCGGPLLADVINTRTSSFASYIPVLLSVCIVIIILILFTVHVCIQTDVSLSALLILKCVTSLRVASTFGHQRAPSACCILTHWDSPACELALVFFNLKHWSLHLSDVFLLKYPRNNTSLEEKKLEQMTSWLM